MVKLYLHYVAAEPNFTYICKVGAGDTRTVADLATLFAAAYNQKHGLHLQPANICLRVEGQQPAASDQPFLQAFKHGSDVYVEPIEATYGAVSPDSSPSQQHATVAIDSAEEAAQPGGATASAPDAAVSVEQLAADLKVPLAQFTLGAQQPFHAPSGSCLGSVS